DSPSRSPRGSTALPSTTLFGSGRYWGRLKADMLANLVHRRVASSDLRPYYRGWAALPEPLWQIAEAEIFARAGWGWLDATITGVDRKSTRLNSSHVKTSYAVFC